MFFIDRISVIRARSLKHNIENEIMGGRFQIDTK